MRSVTQIKKDTAIKELHVALVPKWTTIPDNDEDDLESGSGKDRLTVDPELKFNVESAMRTNNNTAKTKPDICINGAFTDSVSDVGEPGAVSANRAGKAFRAVISSHLNKGEKSLIDCDRTESEIIEDCDKVVGDTVTNSGDTEAFVKSSSSRTGANGDYVKPVVIPEVPKMKYFFERGDSLKKEENEIEKSEEVTEKQIDSYYSIKGQNDSYYSIKGVKRAHEPEVL